MVVIKGTGEKLLEKEFLQQNRGCHIPGYTGHCPTLKFRVGKRYGANTKDILQEMNCGSRPQPYSRNAVNFITKEQSNSPMKDATNRVYRPPAGYILGYTGCIPGLNFRFGETYRHAADASLGEFRRDCAARLEKQTKLNKIRKEPNTCTNMTPLRTRDQVKSAIKQYEKERIALTQPYNTRAISSDHPPIAGYTGHIPRVHSTQASLSQRYATAARQGLLILETEQAKRKEASIIQQSLNSALNGEANSENISPPPAV